jgi:S-DNA-T family DNA segregation ATPase FtsK/SpoIIIE
VSERLVLRLTYVATGAEGRDVLVRATGDARAGDVARALADHLGHAVPHQLYSDRAGRLRPEAPLADGLLRDGDILRPTPVPAGRRGELELWIVGGPDAGRRAPLPRGATTVGRDGDLAIADPSLSRRHLRIVVDGGAAVNDEGSANGTTVEGRRLVAGQAERLAPGAQVEAGRTLFEIHAPLRHERTAFRARAGRIDFNRGPRMAATYEPKALELQPPPARPRGPRLPLAASLAPLALGVVMFIVVKQPAMLLFSALTPVMAVSSYVSERRGGRRAHARDLQAFRERVARLETEIDAMREQEIAARRAAAPDPARLAVRAVEHGQDLWERRRDDSDFLTLRLGTADQPAAFSVTLKEGGDVEERARAEALVAHGTMLPSVPLIAALPEVGGIGLTGDAARVEALARSLVLQAATLHSPRDVVLVAALSEQRAAAWHWLGWLPHAISTRAVVDHPNVAIGRAATQELLRATLAAAAQRREESRRRFGSTVGEGPAILIVIDEDAAPSRPDVDELLAGAQETGVGMIWLGRRRRDLPGGCNVVVDLAADKSAMDVIWPREGRELRDVTADGVSLAVADEVARALAPVRDVSASRAAGTLPRSAPLLEILDLSDLDAERVLERWAAAPTGALTAPLGVSSDGLFTIDLRRDGPHGLVAGTTGAGKSELLQSLVAGMALSLPPTRASFLLVDYKGGAAFKDCKDLPHAAGMVTDLDEHLTRRALLSLNAELRRREHILNAAGVSSLAELERRDPDGAPPSLVIVIDEFAALKTDVPEFVDGVVDIAQRGRSLGVHLILATQRPGGIVSDNIRANTNLRIALRVQQGSESDDVIGDAAAARISKSLPGRAFVRTGHSELAELQSAYAGARTPVVAGAATVSVADLVPGAPVEAESAEPDGPTDLERIVAAVGAATERAELARPLAPWQKELPQILPVDALGELSDAPHVIPVGQLDEPRRQRQRPWGIDLERDGSVFIYGTGGAGKTTLLRTIAVQLARRSEPRHLHLYGLDFAGHGLAVLEALPHCGAVIAGEDEERLTRLLTMLRREIEERGRRFAQRRVSTLSEFRAVAPAPEWPARIVVLLDSYGGFTAAFEGISLGALTQQLPRIIGDGRAAGIHVVATGDRRNAIPHAVGSLVSRRIVLRLADEDDYSALGLDRKGVEGAVLPPGRGFVEETLELQAAIVGAVATGDAPAAAIVQEGARLAERHPGQRAPAIPTMPEAVGLARLPQAQDPARPVVGLEGTDLGPVHADLEESSFLVCGPFKSGRTTALATLASSMHQAGGAELHLLAPRRSALVALDGVFATIARGADQCAESAQRLLEATLARSPEQEHPLLAVVVDDVSELADTAAQTPLETILRRGRDVNVRVIAACERDSVRGFQPLFRELRKDGNGLLLEPSLDMDGDILNVRLPRRVAGQWPPGRGFLVGHGGAVLVQVAAESG